MLQKNAVICQRGKKTFQIRSSNTPENEAQTNNNLVLNFTAQCWIEIYFDEKLIKKQLFLKGESIQVKVEKPFKVDEEIRQKNKLFGRVLINEDYPFGIIKFKDSDIQINNEFDCGNAKIKIILPSWLNIKN